jgi:mono/diheme cytochrome c family protein
VQEQTDGELSGSSATGRGAMPPWKHLPEKDRWALISYIRSVKK